MLSDMGFTMRCMSCSPLTADNSLLTAFTEWVQSHPVAQSTLQAIYLDGPTSDESGIPSSVLLAGAMWSLCKLL